MLIVLQCMTSDNPGVNRGSVFSLCVRALAFEYLRRYELSARSVTKIMIQYSDYAYENISRKRVGCTGSQRGVCAGTCC